MAEAAPRPELTTHLLTDVQHYLPSQQLFPSWQQAASLPQHDILPLPSFDIMQHLPFGQQPLSLPQQPEGAIVVCVALWAIKPKAMTKMLSITNSFDFIISSEFGLRGLTGPL
ncbi:MAG: hypothetical protein ACLPND_13165 [Candidatus Korobacteraceae bacterium]